MKARRQRGFTLVEIIAVLAVIALLGVMILPWQQREKARAQRTNCANQLKSVALGFRLWCSDSNNKYPVQVELSSGGAMELIQTGYVAGVFLVMSNELSTPKILWCPADKRRGIAANFTNGVGNSNVSYFIGVDAEETRPQMLLVGDDNILINGQPVKPGVLPLVTNSPVAWSTARHNQQGNIAFADGSVQLLSSSKLREALCSTGTNIVRLAFP